MTFHRHLPAAALAAALAAWLAVFSAAAEELRHTPAGVAYLSGGVGIDEARAFPAESAHHALAVRTAARGSGAWLADVDLTILDAHGREVFRQRLDGPWLLIDLPPGRYEIVGEHEGEVRRTAVTLPARGHRQAMLYFPVQDETRPHRDEELRP